jgi:hypothetical protein
VKGFGELKIRIRFENKFTERMWIKSWVSAKSMGWYCLCGEQELA